MRSFTSEEGLMAVELDARAAGARRLADKVCVVTGAGQGIGRAVARRLGQEGGRIVVADRIDASATRTLTELGEQGVDALKVLLDLSTFAGARSLMQQALDAHGRIDVLVNNVGGTIWIKPYHLYSEEEVKLELERSLYPTLWCCLAVLPNMMKQVSGSIVNLGSQSIRGLYRTPYAASKGGILALSKVLAKEYGRYGIRINTMSPGATDITDRVTPRQFIRPGPGSRSRPCSQTRRVCGPSLCRCIRLRARATNRPSARAGATPDGAHATQDRATGQTDLRALSCPRFCDGCRG